MRASVRVFKPRQTLLYVLLASLFLGLGGKSWGQLSLTNAANSATIDFSTTISGVSNGAYTAAGFQSSPVSGQLNSNAWSVTGWSDGDLAFGGTRITSSTDYTRGVTSAAVTTGGFYSFTGSPASVSNPAFMIQPGSSDFAPGTLTLRLINNGTTNINSLSLSYNLFVRNDQGRSSSFNFSYSTDNTNYTSVSGLDYTTTAAADVLGWVQVGSSSPSRSTTLNSLNVAPGNYIYIRWSSADVAGSGSRDEIGIDDISVAATFAGATTPTLSVSQALDFGNQCINTSVEKNFTITGSNLTTANVTVAALSGFAYSETNGGPYSASLSLSQPGGSYSKVIYVQFTPTSAVSYNGTAAVGGGGATSVNETLNGAGINTAATVTTGSASSITVSSATIAGSLTAGCASITEYGIEYSTTSGFASGTGTKVPSTNLASGSYTSPLAGLISNTVYYYKAYVTAGGTSTYGSQGSFTTVPSAPTATAATAITSMGFTANWTAPSGNGTITSYTFQYSTTSDFSSGNTTSTSTGTSKAITGLTPATTYYYRVLAINAGGSSVYSSGIQVITSNAAPTVSTATASSITYNSATSGGAVTATNGAPVIAEGVVWNTATGPTIALTTKTSDGTATPFTSSLTGLSANTLYYYRAYATNSEGTSYGTEKTFTTAAAPTLTASPTSLSFANTTVFNSSASQSVALSGLRLTGAPGTITISAPSTDFQVSTDNATFGAMATISYTSGTLSSTTFYVRFTPQTVNTFNGTVTISGGSASTTVAVSGTGIACAAPTTQGSNIVFSNVAANSFTASWTVGNGSGRIAYINVTNSFTDPVDGTSLPAVDAVYNGSGQQAIYAGTGNTVNVSGLSASTIYYVRVYAYNNCSGTYTYQTATATGNPNSVTTSSGACTALIAEDFDYGTIANSNLVNVSGGNWQYLSGTSPVKFNYTPSRGLVYPGYASGGIGGSANIVGTNGSDIYRVISGAAGLTTGAVYSAFLMNFTSMSSTGAYFLPFKDNNTATNAYYGKLFAQAKSGSTTSYELGLTKFAGAATNYTGTFNFGQTYLVVLKYQFNTGATNNDVVTAWAFATGVPASEAAATPLLTVTESGSTPTDANNIYAITMRQNSGNNGYVDGIRVGTSWADAVCAGPVTPVTYTWQPTTGSFSFATSTNWNPVRSTPRNTDILNFTLGGTSTATGVTSQGLGNITVSNNTSISFKSTTGAALGINDDGTTAAADLSIAAGSSLIINSDSAIRINLIGKATASIAGTLTFNNQGTSGTPGRAHRITTETAGNIVFANGSIFNAQNVTGPAFNNDSSYVGTVANGVLFQNGSTFNFSSGATPFELTQPATAVTFNSGSTYRHLSIAVEPSFAGRTYGNFEFAPASGVSSLGFASTTAATVQNNFTITSGTLNFTTASQPLNIGGNVSVASGAVLNYSPTSTTSATMLLNGTSAQTISGAGTFTLGSNSTFSINNSAGVSLQRDLTVGGTLNLAAGSFAVGANTLTLNGPAITGTPANLTTTSASSLSYGGSSSGIIIPSGVAQLNNLTVNNATGISLGGSTSINGTLALNSGIVTTTSANTLTVANTAANAISGGSTTAFINGPLKRTLPTVSGSASTYAFPVGKTTTYLPFSLGAFTTTANPVVTVEAFNANSGGSAGTGLCAISNTEYWLASATAGYSTGSVSLTRQAALGNLNKIGRSATQSGAYNSLNGTVSGTSILNSDPTGTSLGYFVMATFNEISGLTYTSNPASYCVGNTIATNSPSLAVGTAVSYTIAPALPAGLSFNTTNGNITGQPTVVSAATVYTITATNATGCTTSAQVTITVNATPVITNKTAVICSGSTFSVTPVNGVGGDVVPSGTTYTWTAPSVAGVTGTTGGTNQPSVSGTLTNTTSTAKAVVYNVTATSAGSCSGTFTVTVTVDATSVAGTISGAGAVCAGTNSTTLTLNGYVGSIQWQSSTNNVTFSNIAGATSPTYTAVNLTTTTYYRAVVISGSCTAATSASVAVTVNPLPTASISGPSATLCPGSTSGVTITNTGSTTATITYTTQINGGTVISHQITLAAGTGTTLSDIVTDTTTYKLVSIDNGSCVNNAPNGQVVVNVYPAPATPASITGNNYVAIGATVQLSGTPAGGLWSIDNTTYADYATGYNNTSNPVLIRGKAAGTPTVSYTLTDVHGCTNTASIILTVYDPALARYRSKQDGKASDVTTWEVYTGVGNNWENATQIPTNNSNIEVRHNVRIEDVSYEGSASATLTITSHVAGGSTVNGTLTVYPTRHFQSLGSVNFNNNLVILKSDVTGTAAIGTMANPIANAGNVQAEMYTDARKVSGTTLSGPPRRAWRLVTSPVTGQTVHEAWQENQSLNVNPGTGFGTLITGEGLSSTDAGNRGFDYIGNGNHTSIRQYDSTSNQWIMLSTNGSSGTRIPLQSHQAYMLFVRGNRSVTSGTATIANLRATGTIRQGNQTVSILPNRVVNGTTITSYTLVGNPYASTVSFASITGHNTSIKNEFYLWNSHLANYGAYVLVQDDGSGNYQAIPQPLSNGTPTGTISGNTYQFIPSGSAFFVSPSGASSTTLTISEADKTVNGAPPVNPFRAQPPFTKLLRVNLNIKDDTSSTLADGFAAKFDAAFAGSEEESSTQKVWNFNENINLFRNGKNYISEARDDVKSTDTLFVRMWNVAQRSYQLQMRADRFASSSGLQAWLIDNYKGTKNEVSLKGDVTSLDFEVNDDTLSSKSDRFMIVFQNDAVVLPVTMTNISAQPKNNGVQVSWTVTGETNIKGYTVEKSTDGGRNFTAAGTQQAAKNNPQAAFTAYSVYDAHPNTGDNFYRIRIEAKNGGVSYSEIVKVTFGNNGSGIQITLYPNPVREGKANLQLTNLKEGTYLVSIYTASGQTMYQRKIAVALGGVTQSETLLLGNNVAQGSYQIRLSDSKGNILYSDKLVVGR